MTFRSPPAVTKSKAAREIRATAIQPVFVLPCARSIGISSTDCRAVAVVELGLVLPAVRGRRADRAGAKVLALATPAVNLDWIVGADLPDRRHAKSSPEPSIFFSKYAFEALGRHVGR